jgi:hypothetical protein
MFHLLPIELLFFKKKKKLCAKPVKIAVHDDPRGRPEHLRQKGRNGRRHCQDKVQ